MTVELLTDQDEILRFLMKDRLANAYLLGNLDPLYMPFCKWYGARNEAGDLRNLLLYYNGLSIPLVFTSGNGEGLREFLMACRSVLPNRFHFHVMEDQFAALESVFRPEESSPMIRMGLEREDFELEAVGGAVERLGHRDTAAIMELYDHYPDHFFEPYQLETGLYFGIRDVDESLVSIAGVHVVSEEHDVAVIGNLVTHSAHRGKGLATYCTGRLIEELFERVSMIALNVGKDNAPAVKLYENFGFKKNNVFYEGRWSDA